MNMNDPKMAIADIASLVSGESTASARTEMGARREPEVLRDAILHLEAVVGDVVEAAQQTLLADTLPSIATAYAQIGILLGLWHRLLTPVATEQIAALSEALEIVSASLHAMSLQNNLLRIACTSNQDIAAHAIMLAQQERFESEGGNGGGHVH